MMTNKINSVIYSGITGNLIQRVYQHKSKLIAGFTQQYNVTKLVYYEIFESAYEAIRREKQIKGGSRKKKVNLINKFNPE